MTPADQLRAQRAETENAALRAQIASLKDILTATTRLEFPRSLGLSKSLETPLGILIRRPIMTREAAWLTLYSDRTDDEYPEPKILDIFISKLRKKLKPIGVEIETVWGRGYSMSDEHKKILEAMMTPKEKIAA